MEREISSTVEPLPVKQVHVHPRVLTLADIVTPVAGGHAKRSPEPRQPDEGRPHMKHRTVLAVALALGVCAIQMTTPAPAAAQASAPVTAAPRANAAQRANDGVPREIPSNQETGIDIDRFIGDPYKAVTRVTNGGLNARSMLRNGDPYNPGANGAVLEYRDDLSLATLEPRFETAVYSSPMIYFFYVQDGEGTIDSGAGTPSSKVRNGTGILVGLNVKQRFVNTGEKQISMIMMSWLNNDGMKAPDKILTVDTFAKPFGNNRAHWVHMAKGMFNNADGINTTMSAIYFPPMSYGGPHAHVKGVEEIWVEVGDDEGFAILGSEIRRITGTGAFLSPPNGKTYHSSMNLSTDKPSVWLYISRRGPAAQTTPQ
jgi:hypothetical protein